MLFITSWYMPLKTDLFRETCTYDTWLKPFLPSKHPDRLIYMSVTALLENSYYYGVPLENEKDCSS